MKKGDMNERVENEFLDQAITAFVGSYHVRNAAMTAIRHFLCSKMRKILSSLPQSGGYGQFFF